MFDQHGQELLQHEKFAEGVAKGKAEGKAEGITEGISKGKAETARNLLKMGLSQEQIAQATGLTLEEIQSLK